MVAQTTRVPNDTLILPTHETRDTYMYNDLLCTYGHVSKPAILHTLPGRKPPHTGCLSGAITREWHSSPAAPGSYAVLTDGVQSPVL